MPTHKESEKLSLLIARIKKDSAALASKKATAGFDGFVDTIVRIIKKKPEKKPLIYLNRVKEFGNYILEKEGSNFSLELDEISSKPGGNMPITANALGKLGIQVNCIGALGYPQTHPVFNNFSSNCRPYSFAEPGTSTAIEFNDGKIMLYQMGLQNNMGWDKIKETIGIDTLKELYKESDLLCFVNWSEIDASPDIWKGIFRDVFPKLSIQGEKKLSLIDLSDCSKRSNEAIEEMLAQLEKFAQHTKLILSLNKNEAQWIYKVIYKNSEKDLEELGVKIFEKLKPAILLLHSSKQTIAIKQEDVFRQDSFFIKNPQLSTGAGDNFNAGFAAAQLMKWDPALSLLFANNVAALYVKTGISPQPEDVLIFLEELLAN
jgi:hypothetical protein